ncbi:MAG: relaxase/mobilization nuclease domain-containing protein [Proteobacteria bacterium]|nr:relaxase/mobilization nuclease domain-containing protein [Pseudomonadota bacterium]
MLDIFSYGHPAPAKRLTPRQIGQITRTVRRVPEVMVKVTGGGANAGAVGAHFSYIGRNGQLEIETDYGVRIAAQEEQKTLLADWHLELSAGQYRGEQEEKKKPRKTKLVYNIVFSMPFPTPPAKVLAGARRFAQDKFAFQHRYAMVLHADQRHPHVHMVVKAEGDDGQRLYVDKAMLRQWREDFARMMREQGIAANATPRVARGRNRDKTRDARYRADHHGTATASRSTVKKIMKELHETGTYKDAARPRLLETRRAVVGQWMLIADTLETQGETALAGEVRHFARQLPPVLTKNELLAVQVAKYLRQKQRDNAVPLGKADELTR